MQGRQARADAANVNSGAGDIIHNLPALNTAFCMAGDCGFGQNRSGFDAKDPGQALYSCTQCLARGGAGAGVARGFRGKLRKRRVCRRVTPTWRASQ